MSLDQMADEAFRPEETGVVYQKYLRSLLRFISDSSGKNAEDKSGKKTEEFSSNFANYKNSVNGGDYR